MLITVVYNIATLIMLAVAPYPPPSTMNIVMFVAMIVCGLLCMGVREQYRRSDSEAHSRKNATGRLN